MMEQCRQRCWIAAGVAGLLVLAGMSLLGTASIVAGLLLGLLTTGLLGGLLVWGVCTGHGSRAENEALMASYWQPEAFDPSRKVVAPGGKTVSTRPLGAATPEGLAGTAPLDSVTLQASRDPAMARPVEFPLDEVRSTETPVTETGAAALEHDEIPPPSETVALLATPSIASAIPVAPLALTQTHPVAPSPAGPTGQATGQLTAEPTEFAARAEEAAAAAGIALGPDRVATTTEPYDAARPYDGSPHDGGTQDGSPQDGGTQEGDDLTRVDGIGPMQAQWLRDARVESLAQIASWDDSDISRFAGMMGRDGHRIRTEDWVGQSARLTMQGGLV